MKTIEVKFTTVLAIVLALILLALSIYIYNEVQGRYELNKQIQISYTTPDYYFDVTLDTTEIKSFPATINVTAKNNNGTNYTTEDLTYTIGLDNSNYTVTAVGGNTRTLAGGRETQETYAITINKTGTDTSDKINLIFTVNKPYTDTKSQGLEINTIPAYYGALVTNYSANGISAWRVFHKDENGRVYLITDDYVEYDKLPKDRSQIALNKYTDYTANFKDIVNNNYYTGSAWIRSNTNANARKWLNKYLTAYPGSTNGNIKAVAYMMDTTKWRTFVNTTYAEYAIGGPTTELFCASYKVTHPDKYIECDSVIENGYKVKWNNNGNYGTSISGLTKNDYNKIYIIGDSSKANGMWLASPSSSYEDYVQSTGDYGGIAFTFWDMSNSGVCGFRPIVCLKSGVDIVSNGDGTYKIQ